MNTKEIHISDYSYELPDERIAKYPIAERDHSKLLVYNHGRVGEDSFYNLPDYLPEGALMVMNNTRVIQARLHFRKATGAIIEIFLLEPYAPADYEQMFQQQQRCSWLCLIGNQKKWKDGTLERTFDVERGTLNVENLTVNVKATRKGEVGTSQLVEFEWQGCSFADVLDAMGELPIPPYLNRESQESDKTTYQTVYSKIKGSVAAPTAGLHFTERVLQAIDAHGIEREEVTLHVGAGTFRPVKVDKVEEHHMHTEFYRVPQDAADMINRAKDEGRRVIAVGTTSCRTLESAGDDQGHVHAGSGDTGIFIYPGYTFKVMDGLITNFHLPKSTLVMLVSAFAGREHVLNAYRKAIEERYRFFSFGDACYIADTSYGK